MRRMTTVGQRAPAATMMDGNARGIDRLERGRAIAASPIRVIVVDERDRERSRRLAPLWLVPGISVVATAATAIALMVAVEATPFDVILVVIAFGPNPGGMHVLGPAGSTGQHAAGRGRLRRG